MYIEFIIYKEDIDEKIINKILKNGWNEELLNLVWSLCAP